MGASDPSYKLIDRFATISAKGEVRYVPWDKCSERSQELIDAPDVKALRIDQAGFLQSTATAMDPSADTSTDLLLDLALRRRALAADIAGLMKFETMNEWHEILKAEFLRTPPPGYRRISIGQLRTADEDLFRFVSERCRDGLGPPAGGAVSLFETAWKDGMRDFNIRLRLAPLPRAGGGGGGGERQRRRPEEGARQDARTAGRHEA